MAKIDFSKYVVKDLSDEVVYPTKPVKDDAGNVISMTEDKTAPPVTVGDLIRQSLTREDPKATPEERFEYFRLAIKVKEAKGEVDYSLDEIMTMKKKAGESSLPLVVGRVWEVLNTLDIPKSKEKGK